VYGDNETCDGDDFCRWFNFQPAPKCQTRCSQRNYASPTTCTADPECDWNYSENICVTLCTEHFQNETCISEGLCAWFTDGKCRKKCSQRTASSTKAGCQALGADCMWDELQSSCTESCPMGYFPTMSTQCLRRARPTRRAGTTSSH
jgi:hypothetical protein